MTEPIPSLPFKWKVRNKMLICSLATGPKHRSLLQIMSPTVVFYALQHKMDTLLLPLGDRRLDGSRPPSWDKIILMYNALSHYDTVMWIDADAMIIDPFRDIREVLDPKYSVYLVPENPKGDWFYVNGGMWVCQRKESTFRLLEAVWNKKKFIHNSCWEQAALMDLLGFGFNPRQYRGPTPFTSTVGFLPQEWNAFPKHKVKHPVIIHHADDETKDLLKFQQNYERFLNRIWPVD